MKIWKIRLTSFRDKLFNIEFSNKNFKEFDFSKIKSSDFVYCDPPYRSSVGSYNDGKRGFEGWTLDDDLALFEILDELNDRKIKFALSNVFFNNGLANKELQEWSGKYKVHLLKINYSNSNYQRNKLGETKKFDYKLLGGNMAERTLGWIQNPSSFENLKNVVSVFDKTLICIRKS